MQIFSLRTILAGLQAVACAATLTAGATPAPAESAPSDAPAQLRTWHDLPAPVAGSAFKTDAPLAPVSLATADFDEDGMPDLAVGYTAGAESAVALYRGNVDAVYPNAPEARQRTGRFADDPFLPEPLVAEAPVAPDLLAAGDFDADGHADLALASRGGDSLTVLPGDGCGGFRAPAGAEPEALGARAAVVEIPMRLNSDGVDDLVVLRPGHAVPSVALSVAGSTFTVTTANNSGLGSLRQAILNANATPGLDQIAFDIPGAAPVTIRPLSQLPAITEALLLDGTTQPGFAGTPVVELDGSLAPFSSGLTVGGSTSTCVIRGLVVNRFAFDGIFLTQDADNVTIEGNYIGTTPTGRVAAPNLEGIRSATSGDVLIGGETAAARNVVAGNGKQIVGARWNWVQIFGNYIGVDASGASALAADAEEASIAIRDVSDRFGLTQIGSPARGARNVISGVVLLDAQERETIVQNNYIGVDATGGVGLGRPGALVLANGEFLVGGTTAAAANVISGLGTGPGFGGAVNAVSPSLCDIKGNRIGTDATGQLAIGNEPAGVFVFESDASPGGVNVTGNVVAFNGGAGVVAAGATARAFVSANSIHSNGGLGIDVGNDGVTPNDAGDFDHGPNEGQNAPVLASAAMVGNKTIVSGTLDSLPDDDFLVEIFASAESDPSGSGEGKTFLGSVEVSTDAAGVATFTVTLSGAPRRSQISATATSPSFGTSEFSQCIPLAGSATAGGAR